MELQLEHKAEMVGTGTGVRFWRDHFEKVAKP